MSQEHAFGVDAVLADVKASRLDQVQALLLAELEAQHAMRPEDRAGVEGALKDRERVGSTAIGNGVAIPHARVDAVKRMILSVARVAEPGLPAGPDGKPVRLVFCFLSPRSGSADDHLVLLQRISRAARDPAWVEGCLTAPGPEGFVQRLKAGSARRR